MIVSTSGYSGILILFLTAESAEAAEQRKQNPRSSALVCGFPSHEMQELYQIEKGGLVAFDKELGLEALSAGALDDPGKSPLILIP